MAKSDNARKTKELFTNILEEATLDTTTLENIQDLEPKLYKLKRKHCVKIFRDGDHFKIKGSKKDLTDAKESLLGPIESRENLVIRGIENSEEVLFLLTGGTWGISDDAEKCVQLKKIKKSFPIGFFCMFVSKNSVKIIEQLLDFKCELKVEEYGDTCVKVVMKGSKDYVDNIFGYIEGRYREVQSTLRVHFQYINVKYKSHFVDALEDKLSTLMITYKGRYLDLVLSEKETRNVDQIKKAIYDIEKCMKEDTVYCNVKKILQRLCPSENQGQQVVEEKSESKDGTHGNKVTSSCNRKPQRQKDDKKKTIELDQNDVQYLKECLWRKVEEEASEFGIKTSATDEGISLSPISQDFQQDCEKLEQKLKEYLSTVKTVSIDISTVPKCGIARKREQIEKDAKECNVFVRKDDSNKLVARGMVEDLDIFVQHTKTTLGIVEECRTIRSTAESPSCGADAHSDSGPWETVHCSTDDNAAACQTSHTSLRTSQGVGAQFIAKDNDASPDPAQSMPKSCVRNSSEHMTVYKHSATGIQIHCGIADITTLDVECVVNAANEDLRHYGGVAYAIARAAGYELETESRSYVLEHGPLNIAGVCVTTGGNMPCQKVLHTVGPMWSQYGDNEDCVNQLQEAFVNCLNEAEKLYMSSIAFPAISSGIFGVPMYYVSRAACEAICRFCLSVDTGRNSIQDIYLVDITSETIHSFNSALSSYVGSGGLENMSTAV